MRELILKVLNDKDYLPTSYQGIASILQLNDSSLDLNEIYKTLVYLENEYEIIRGKSDKVQLTSKLKMYKGKINLKKGGFGFVRAADFDVFVAQKNLNGALDNDDVLVKVISQDGLNYEGEVFKIIKRSENLLVGTVLSKQGRLYIQPDDIKISHPLVISKKNTIKIVEGNKILFNIISFDEKSGNATIKIKSVIGHINDVGIDILSIVYKYGFDPEFSNEAMLEAQQYKDIEPADLKNRQDLRDDLTITIDGSDAKDLDDAISLEILENGNYLLKVSIADVSHYVKEDSALDKDAYERGTSVYLIDRVVPMLPFALSNGVCSLLPNVDRLTQTCEMEIDSKGNVVDYKIYESIINSKYRLTYDEVALIISNEVEHNDEILNQMLLDMDKLALLIRTNKQKRGMLNFDVPEAYIIVDKKGVPQDIKIRERNDAHLLIEDFMIIANETVASHIFWLDLPFIYRVHDKPNSDKILFFIKFVSIFGIKLKGKKDNITSKDVQKLLSQIQEDEKLHFLDRLLLRTMAKAVYSRDSIGHFGLGSKCYTHFTSPIRRYPDLIVHRLLRQYLYNKDQSIDKLKEINEKLVTISADTSRQERSAIEAEREVNDMKMAQYMENHLNELFDARITSVTSFGLFVELENTIEGLVHISTLSDDHYVFIKEQHMLIGQRKNKKYILGDSVRVKATKASAINREVDFRIV